MDKEESKYKDLWQKAIQGNEEAFIGLYQEFLPFVYQFIYYRVGNKEEAEDLTQETFIKILESLKSYRGEAKIKSWFYGIARHVIADYFRKIYKADVVPFLDDLELIKKEEFENEEEHSKIIGQILKQLPENYRQVLELRFLKNYSIRETAQKLKISENNVKVLQFRAIKKAKDIFKEYGKK